jgi:5-(carboxyamino)imidazole ribonucleotide synthase
MKKIGILGGGQLGRMLLQAAANYPVETYVLEKDSECPAAHLCHHFVKGDITQFEDVYNFGKGMEALTIEIESVNIDALKKLEAEGVQIFPKPSALEIIKNKISQKEFYKQHDIPTSDFVVTHRRNDLQQLIHFIPAVHKLALGGYDGKGVEVLKSETDMDRGFDKDAVLERLVAIKKEISLIVAIGQDGKSVIYPPVEMIFNPDLNLLEYQISPAIIAEKILWKAEAIALTVVRNLESPGIFAVELFIDIDDHVLVNETAPRVHNSGHHTIEAGFSSQFDMLFRIMLGYPLGNTKCIMNAAMVNLIGEKDHTGEAKYLNIEEVLQIDNVFVHIYGKKETRPGRKMGHVTILSDERQHLIHIAHKVKQLLKVVS